MEDLRFIYKGRLRFQDVVNHPIETAKMEIFEKYVQLELSGNEDFVLENKGHIVVNIDDKGRLFEAYLTGNSLLLDEVAAGRIQGSFVMNFG